MTVNLTSDESEVICTTHIDPQQSDTDFTLSATFTNESPPQRMEFVNLTGSEKVIISSVDESRELPVQDYPNSREPDSTVTHRFAAGRQVGYGEAVVEEPITIGLRVNGEIIETVTVLISC